MLDRKKFYDAVRPMFGGHLTASQVAGMDMDFDVWEKSYQVRTPFTQLGYCMATEFHETNRTMQPVKEIGGVSYFTRLYDVKGANPARARSMGNTRPGDGARFCGRGKVQLTWKNNYFKATVRLLAMGVLKPGESLVDTPALAQRPDIATVIMFEGMESGWFTGVDLDDTIDAMIDGDEHADAVKARRIINGKDRAELIAGYSDQILHGLQIAA